MAVEILEFVVPVHDHRGVAIEMQLVVDDLEVPRNVRRQRLEGLQIVRSREDHAVLIDVNGVGSQSFVPDSPISGRQRIQETLIAGLQNALQRHRCAANRPLQGEPCEDRDRAFPRRCRAGERYALANRQRAAAVVKRGYLANIASTASLIFFSAFGPVTPVRS